EARPRISAHRLSAHRQRRSPGRDPMTPNRRTTLALMAGAFASPAMAAEADPIAGMTVINALGGLIDPNDTTERDRPVLTRRIMDDARASGMTAVNVTVGYVFGPKEPFQESVGDVAMFSRLIAENPRDLIKVTTIADIARAKAEKKVGVILGFQNAAMMGDDPKRVD